MYIQIKGKSHCGKCEFSPLSISEFVSSLFKSSTFELSSPMSSSTSNVNESDGQYSNAPTTVAVVGGAGERSEPRGAVPEGGDQVVSLAGEYFDTNKHTGDSSVATRIKVGTL